MSTGRKLGLGDQLYNFLRSLGEEACTRNNVAICVSVPSSSDVEMNPEDRHDYEAIKQMLDRLGKAILMSADKEMAEIIRRRLFEWGGMPEEGRKTASAYAEWAVEHAQELTGIDADTAYETFLSAYPFHPAVLSGLRAEMAEPASIPADPRRPADAGAVGFARLSGRTSQGGERAADHPGAGAAGRPDLSGGHFRATWVERVGNPRDDRHRRQERCPRCSAGQGSDRGRSAGPVAPQSGHDDLLRVQRRHEPGQGRRLGAGNQDRRLRSRHEHGRCRQRAGGAGQQLLLPELGSEPVSLRVVA